MRKGGTEIEEKKRRRTVCTSSFFDDDSGAGFLQRFPEFKWLLVLVYNISDEKSTAPEG